MGCEALVILAAGAGRRFGGAKQLASVGPGGEALMEYTVFGAREVGFRRFVVVTRADLAAAVGARLGSVSGEMVLQADGVGGTVPAVLAARRVLEADQSFAVVNADDLYPAEALGALKAWDGPGHAVAGFRLAATMLEGSGTVNRALCRVADDGGGDRRLEGLVEAAITRRGDSWVATPRGGGPASVVPGDQLVSMNAWVLQPSIWPVLAAAAAAGSEAGPEVLLPVVVGDLVASREGTVAVLPVRGRCIGITWPHELAVVRATVAGMVAAGQLPRLTAAGT